MLGWRHLTTGFVAAYNATFFGVFLNPPAVMSDDTTGPVKV